MECFSELMKLLCRPSKVSHPKAHLVYWQRFCMKAQEEHTIIVAYVRQVVMKMFSPWRYCNVSWIVEYSHLMSCRVKSTKDSYTLPCLLIITLSLCTCMYTHTMLLQHFALFPLSFVIQSLSPKHNPSRIKTCSCHESARLKGNSY